MAAFLEKINWRELAFLLLDNMYVNYGEKWTAQWLYDEGFDIGTINWLLGSEYTEEDLKREN